MDCDVCVVNKSTQFTHPTAIKHDITSTWKFVFTGLMEPISPTALRSSRYTAKITDQFTRWKERVLIKQENDATEAFKVFVQEVVLWDYDRSAYAPTKERISPTRCSRATAATRE